MKIREERTPALLRIHLEGDLDVYQSPALKVKIMSLAEDNDLPPKSCLDFSRVDYVDSAGLGAVIDAHRRLESAGSPLRLVNLNEDLFRTFKFARLIGFLDIESPRA
ncbi:MAG: STAS domain-containing protein [Leptospirales bacterium]|jgi:anti-sigma B factor antagonist